VFGWYEKKAHAHIPQNTLDALVDESEGSCLEAITPHLKPLGRCLSLSAEGSRCLLTTTCWKDNITDELNYLLINPAKTIIGEG